MQLTLEKTYSLRTDYMTPKHFVVVGAGGNGGYYIPQLVRQVALQNRIRDLSGLNPHIVTVIDADEVEDKNLNRQNFIQPDVGQNKAYVLANRYGRAFGIEVNYQDSYLTDKEDLKKIIRAHSAKPVFVGAVDNNKTRKIIYDVFKESYGAFYLDAGNEEWAGQVVCGYNSGGQKLMENQSMPHYFDLPSICDMYPEVLEAQDKLPTEMSCAERAESAPQNIFTNQTAANLLLGFTNTILTSKEGEGEGLNMHAVIFDAEAMNFTTKFNRKSVLFPEPPKEEVAEVEVEPKKPAKKAVKKQATEGVAE